MMCYLHGTLDLPLILSGDGTGIAKWWVDGSHVMHPNLCGHSEGCMSLGEGMIVTNLMKQKLNTRSSTETNLIMADDYMPAILWTNHSLCAQGFNLKSTILHQDNQSAILLERNGRHSSSRHTRHIDICFYFITNQIACGDLSVEYCPTELMVADFFMKPLQGNLFLKFWHMIMNYPK